VGFAEVPCLYRLRRESDESTNGEGVRVTSAAPIHRELLLIVGLDWAVLWETLYDPDGAVELGIDKLVRVHDLDERQCEVQEAAVGG